MNLDKNHDKAFKKIHEEHEGLITTLITYMDSRRENAKAGEISFQHNHKRYAYLQIQTAAHSGLLKDLMHGSLCRQASDLIFL